MTGGIRYVSPRSGTMSSRYTPSYVEGESLLHPRYVRIPKDQNRLLEEDSAWSENLKKGPHGEVNIPPHVLESLKQLHAWSAKQQGKAPSHPKSSPAGRRSLRTSPHTPSRAVKKRRSEEATEFDRDDDGDRRPSRNATHSSPAGAQNEQQRDDDDRATVLSWSPSPKRDRQPSLPPPPPPPPLSSRESQEEARPRPPARVFTKPPMSSFPSSNVSSDDDLEIEAPIALNTHLQPVNKVAAAPLPGLTPPSAQIIPCTYNEKSSPANTPQPKRRRLMKAITIDSSPPDPADMMVSTRMPSMAPQTMPSRMNPDIKSSAPTSSSALPDTSQERPPQTIAATAGARPPSSSSRISSTEGYPPASARTLAPAGTRRHSTTQTSDVSMQQEELPTEVKGEGHCPAEDVSSAVSNISAPLVPKALFPAYKAAYPSFKGGLAGFISGSICVFQLGERRALPSFLYDDFIRAFCESYLLYVDGLEDHMAPLTAVEWYNVNVERPIFDGGIVTKSNIQEILSAYPDEVDTAKASIRDGSLPLQGPPERRSVSKAPDGTTQMAFATQAFAHSVDIGEIQDKQGGHRDQAQQDLTASVEEDDDGSVEQVEMTTSTPASKAVETIPQTVFKAKGPPPLASEGSWRKSFGGSPLPTSSPASSSRSRRKRSAEDPALRSKKFRKFLERKRLSLKVPSSSVVPSTSR